MFMRLLLAERGEKHFGVVALKILRSAVTHKHNDRTTGMHIDSAVHKNVSYGNRLVECIEASQFCALLFEILRPLLALQVSTSLHNRSELFGGNRLRITNLDERVVVCVVYLAANTRI